MPDFQADEFYVSPSEFVDSCNSKEIKQLIECLMEDGHIDQNKGIQNPNVHDVIFEESINQIKKSRDLLTLEEEDYINNISKRIKYLR